MQGQAVLKHQHPVSSSHFDASPHNYHYKPGALINNFCCLMAFRIAQVTLGHDREGFVTQATDHCHVVSTI